MTEAPPWPEERLRTSFRRHAAAAEFHRQRAAAPSNTEPTDPDLSAPGPLTAAEHKVRSVIHRFMTLVEDPARDAAPIEAILAPTFSLHYADPPIRDLDALRAWVAGPLSSVAASEHVIQSVTLEPEPGGWRAVIAIQSQAMFPDRSGVVSRTRQTWAIRDGDEAYPRIAEILVERDALDPYPAPDAG